MTNPFDKLNLDVRRILTPAGEGLLQGINNKVNPTIAIVSVGEGKTKKFKSFPVEELMEVLNERKRVR